MCYSRVRLPSSSVQECSTCGRLERKIIASFDLLRHSYGACMLGREMITKGCV